MSKIVRKGVGAILLCTCLLSCKSTQKAVNASKTPDKCSEFVEHWNKYVHYISMEKVYYISDTLAEWVNPEQVRQYNPYDSDANGPDTRIQTWSVSLMEKCFIGKAPADVIRILGPPTRYMRKRAIYELVCRRPTDFCSGQGIILVDTSAQQINRVDAVPSGIQVLP